MKKYQVILLSSLRSLTIILVFGIASNLQAQDASDLVDLSLEELLNINISIASQKDETIANSPAIVTTIEMKDMRLFGVRTLQDALAHVPGIVIQDSPVGSISIMIRGLAETFNQKVLFLLDGVPYWMSSHGDIPLLGIPVEMIDRIEIIRGPGSVIYGTNASAGVINVILIKNVDKTQLNLFGGSHGLINVNVYHTKQFEDGQYYFGAARQSMSEGYNAKYDETLLVFPFNIGLQINKNDTIPFPTSGTIKKKEESYSIISGLKYKNFNITGNYFNQTLNGLGGAPVIFQKNDLIYRGLLLHADFRYDVSDFDIKLFADYNPFFLELDIDNFLATIDSNNIVTSHPGKQQYVNPFSNNYRMRTGSIINFNISSSGNMVAGIENEIRNAGEYQKTTNSNDFIALQSNKTSVNEFSSFLQFDWKFGQLRSIAGARYVNNELAGSHISPRASVIYNFNQSNSVKLLFSEGFNSPVISQQDLYIPFVVKGNKGLKAELIRSFDLAYTSVDQSQIVILNAYYIKIIDAIDREKLIGETEPQYRNLKGYHRYGLELDYQKSYNRLKFIANLAYYHQGNKKNDNDKLAEFVPRFTFNAGFKYHFYENHYFGFSNRFIGKRGEVGNINILNAAYDYELYGFNLSLNMENILDTRILNPDVNSGRIPSIPGGPGRSIYFGVIYTLY